MTAHDGRTRRESTTSTSEWSRGKGVRWVIAQAVLFIGFFLVPTYSFPSANHEAEGVMAIIRTIAGFIMLAGFIEFTAGIFCQGRNLTPFPLPGKRSHLVERGAYRLIRHPIYGGMILTVIGWTVFHASISHALMSLVLIGFFDAKARLEERVLIEKLTGYDSYRKSVRWRFVPHIY